MGKSVLTPAHPHSLDALLDAPFTRTLDHAPPQRQAQVFVRRRVARSPVPLQGRLQRRQRLPRGVRQALDRQGLDHVGQAPVRLARPPPVSGPTTPPPRPGRAAVEPSRRSLPQGRHSGVKVQDAPGNRRPRLLLQPP